MDAWFPKLNSKGQVVSGSGSIWFRENYRLVEGIRIGEGWSSGFLNDEEIIFNSGHNTKILSGIDWHKVKELPDKFNTIVAGCNSFIGCAPPNLKFKDYIAQGKSPSIAKGNVVWIEPYFTDQTSIKLNLEFLKFNGQQYTAPIYNVEVGENSLVWSLFTGKYTRATYGVLFDDLIVQDISVTDWEVPAVVDTPKGPYVYAYTQTGLVVRQFANKKGYFYIGSFYNPHAIWLGDRIVVIGSDEKGNSKYIEVDIRVEPRDLSDISNLHPSPIPTPIPVPAKPSIPKPTIPIEKPEKLKEEAKKMIPQITDSDIVELALVYDRTLVNKKKNEADYFRDLVYYAYGYARLLATEGVEKSKSLFSEASFNDAYYPILPTRMIMNDEVIDLSIKFIEYYKEVQRYQRQNREENGRDAFYWTIVYARDRELSDSHERALKAVRKGIRIEAGIEAETNRALTPLVTDRQIFRYNDGTPFKYKGVSFFKGMDLFSKGEDILPFLRAFPSSNTVTVFAYTPQKDWGAQAWNIPALSAVDDFIDTCAHYNFKVEIVILTSDDDSWIEPGKKLIERLIQSNQKNIFVRVGNEPLTHKTIKVDLFKDMLARSGLLYTSGVYEDLKKFYGNYGDYHSARTDEWPVKGKGVIEAYRGGGPNYKEEPARKVPWILGEPIKPSEAKGNNIIDDFYTYGVISNMGAGVTFHFEGGKFGLLPSSFEMACYTAMNKGQDMLPDETAYGDYDRIDEFGNTLRTYTIGNYIIRARPQNILMPKGWRALDTKGICGVKG